jgi:hypothetical protein
MMSRFNEAESRIVEFLLGQPNLVEQHVERSAAGLPNWFVNWATVVGVASSEFLRAANYDPGSRPPGWQSDRPGVFWKPVGSWASLLVRQCREFWTIERERCRGETLFAGEIICARTREAAMRLSEFCYPLPDGLCGLGLRWIETKP